MPPEATWKDGTLAIASLNDFIFGRAPKPVTCGRGVEIGTGTVIPEVNFTLPPIDIGEATWPEIRDQYSDMIRRVCERAVALEAPALLVEFETLPPMTMRPAWGADVTRILADTLQEYHDRHGQKNALRLTPNDNRDMERPTRMKTSQYWEGMMGLFSQAAGAGADLLAIESTGGKEISDEALMTGDLRALVFALGVLACRDMEFLWDRIVGVCKENGVIPSGDTACGFANTAMALAEQKMIPRVFAAVARVAAVPRSLVAYERGAVGPSKDCAYEGPYMKAIAGVPISMEGRSAACAHLSTMGNIAQAVCDCWSNESVQNVRLLSDYAPTVSVEQLIYDCRLLNSASKRSHEDAVRLRDWLSDSDSALDPQAYVLRPDVVLRISQHIVKEPTHFLQTRRAALVALEEIRNAWSAGHLRITETEARWLDRMSREAEVIPEDEDAFIREMLGEMSHVNYVPEEYGLTP
ncbi:MAG: methanol--corrinoid methyltransferase [Fimbriimonadia bacterium]|jgi:methanol--5-hydroxybenzimidazolylcobamide Co-methyltransferase